jgi:hypothetical protein
VDVVDVVDEVLLFVVMPDGLIDPSDDCKSSCVDDLFGEPLSGPLGVSASAKYAYSSVEHEFGLF